MANKTFPHLLASLLTIDEDTMINILAESILNDSLEDLGIVEMNKPLADRIGISYQRLKWCVVKMRETL
jgi:hypothetical protein